MKTASRKAKAHRRMPSRPAGKALMRIPAPPAQPWALTLDEVALVKNHIAKGATDDELKFCVAVARRYKLDPFRQQIWFVKRADRTAEGGYRWIPITGINGLLHIAARDHKDFGSNDEPEYGPMHEVSWSYNGRGGKFQAPEWARVTVWKKGHEHPVVSTVYWSEIYPNVDTAPLVRQMPRLMLGKCALAQAIRRAYPATDGLYVKEEFQGPSGLTPQGRVMTVEEEAEKNPHLKSYLDSESHYTPAQKEVLEKKLNSLNSQPAAQQSAKPDGAESERKATSAPSVQVVKFPQKHEGDVTVRCDDRTSELMGLKRRGASQNEWLVRYDSMVAFSDRAREKGVAVISPEA